jgi:hypothetical protein
MLVGREDNIIRGAFALRRRAPHRFDCGYVLARRWWRQGLMTEVLTEIAAWALRQPSMFRIGAMCDVENIGSARVLEKAGFVREGVLHRWLVHPNISDEPRDCLVSRRSSVPPGPQSETISPNPTLEPLHFVLSSPHHLMRVFGSIVHPHRAEPTPRPRFWAIQLS